MNLAVPMLVNIRDYVSVQGWCSKAPQTRQLQTTGVSHSLEAWSPTSRCHQGCVPYQTPGEGSSCLIQPLVAPGFLGLWPHLSNLCLCWHMATSLRVSPISLCLSLTRTPVIAHRVHLDNPEYSPLLKVFKRHLLQHKMTFTLSPCKVTFTGFRGENVHIYHGGTFLSLSQDASFLGSDSDAVETIGDRMCMCMLFLGNLSGIGIASQRSCTARPVSLVAAPLNTLGHGENPFPHLLTPSSCHTWKSLATSGSKTNSFGEDCFPSFLVRCSVFLFGAGLSAFFLFDCKEFIICFEYGHFLLHMMQKTQDITSIRLRLKVFFFFFWS